MPTVTINILTHIVVMLTNITGYCHLELVSTRSAIIPYMNGHALIATVIFY